MKKYQKDGEKMGFNKEYVYDQEIAPLVSQIIEVCKSNDIPMVASFCYGLSDNDAEDLCTTFITQSDGWVPESFEDCRKRLFSSPFLMAFTITKPNKIESDI